MQAFPHITDEHGITRPDPNYDPVKWAEMFPAEHIKPVVRRKDGWTAERQRDFLATLADTGCVSVAADAVGITPRSAYRLRHHPRGQAFAAGWDAALATAANRLAAVAFERAIIGARRETWRDGKLIAEQIMPSDRMLMFLLTRLSPQLYAADANPAARAAAVAAAQARLPQTLATLTDQDVDADYLEMSDYLPQPPSEYEA